jgi:hypothetical protein
MAKEDTSNAKRGAIDAAHKFDTTDIGLIQQGQNIVHNIGSAFKRKMKNITGMKHVHFSCNTQVHIIPSCHEAAATVLVIYDSGADRHYITKTDQVQAQLPILQKASKRVAVAHGETCKAKFVTHLPFHTLSTSAKQAETFTEFLHSLMSVGKTADNSMISIFTKKGVTHFLSTATRTMATKAPIKNPGMSTPASKQRIRFAINRTTVKWMHAVCGYPVKSTWTKAIKAGNFVGWPILTERNVNRYYPDTDETSKGHMNQTWKNVQSTKQAPI